VAALRDGIAAKSEDWKDIVKIGRTHMQDATPLTLGEEWLGYAGMLGDGLVRIEDALKGVYQLALGGTAVGVRSRFYASSLDVGFGNHGANNPLVDSLKWSFRFQYAGLPYFRSTGFWWLF
jgi:argininosuccinate lyase